MSSLLTKSLVQHHLSRVSPIQLKDFPLTVQIFVEQYIPLWGCPHTLLSDNGSGFVARLSLAIYKLMRIRKIATTAFHPNSNGGVERVNRSLAQMLSLVISEQQDDWDK